MRVFKRHAFLIIAHNEFDVLERLLLMLDDSRNDIYIHFDKKIVTIPELKVKYSRLFILEDRIDVRWGDITVVEAEYKLFESSYKNGPYLYYHLLSGVDLPLRSMDDLHSFFDHQGEKEFIGFSTYDYDKEVVRKVNYVHLYSRYFRKTGSFGNNLFAISRAVCLRVQILLGIKRNKKIQFKKGTQWVSVTNPFVHLLLDKRGEVMQMYKNTFCADEIYKQTICWNSEFQNHVYSYQDEAIGSMRMIGWKDGQLRDWQNGDYELLINSGKLFARKFNSKNIEVVDCILRFVQR